MAKNGIIKRRRIATAWDGYRYLNSSHVPAVTAPSGLSATPSGTTMSLSWTNGLSNADILVERSPNGSSGWSVIATKTPTTTTHSDTSLANGTYYYRVRHLINATYSDYSSSANGTISGGTAGFAHGSSYTLTGTGFGTKSEPLPIMFDNFSSGTVGNNVRPNSPTVSASGTWVWDDQGITSTRPVYSTDVLRTGRTRSAKAAYGGSVYANALEIIDTGFTAAGAEKFISWWLHYDLTSASHSINFKPFIAYGTFENQVPEFYLGYGAPSSDDQLRNSFQDKVSGAGSAGIINTPTIYAAPNVDAIEGSWVKFELWIKQSTADTFDGAFQLRVHNPDDGSAITMPMDDATVRTRLYSDRNYRNFLIGAYHASSGGATGNVYVSDVYCDNTRQRVELGDASTWAACKWTEAQVATAWSNTSITITANAGAFTAGQTAYLYVIDANGAPVSTSGTAVTVA